MTIGERTFSADRWASAYRRTVDRAFREVPFYREQWAVAGRVLADPEPVHSADLRDDLFRLCPLRAPWRPDAEPSLWTGDPAVLREAVRFATGARAVVEARDALIDWTSLGRGVRYAPALPPGADAGTDAHRRALNRAAAVLAARPGTVLVSDPATLPPLLSELAGDPLPLRRLPLATALAAGEPCLAHDPRLGYFAARPASCGLLHPIWRRFHLGLDRSGLPLLTDLRRTRPTLVNVIPAESVPVTITLCGTHRSPVVTGPGSGR